MAKAVGLGLIAALLVGGSALGAERGIASVYDGGPAACGGRVNPHALVAAHRRIPCGAWVTVTNLRNGRSVRVRIVDRGPFVRGRIIDLTPAGARALGFSGLVRVDVSR